MAIGLPLPPPHVPRLRLQWRFGGTVFARQMPVLKAGILRVVSVTRVLWKRLVHAAQDVLNLRARTRQRQRAQCNVFEQQFEGLVDLLCVSAREGIRSDRERAYKRTRAWMLAHYPCIARHVRPYWAYGSDNGSDPFLPLFCQPQLEDTLNAEDGIERIMASRTALESYRAELDAARA